jgi:hypothetical protein
MVLGRKEVQRHVPTAHHLRLLDPDAKPLGEPGNTALGEERA